LLQSNQTGCQEGEKKERRILKKIVRRFIVNEIATGLILLEASVAV